MKTHFVCFIYLRKKTRSSCRSATSVATDLPFLRNRSRRQKRSPRPPTLCWGFPPPMAGCAVPGGAKVEWSKPWKMEKG